ncbi:Putative serine protease HtrA [Roseimaritima multifibrata]|uniref:Serine protease HtrA n=1 Tax=Roseimaritima multifibrata TaxID=1930274 RepID=A0A517MCJ7_9BACT|nr:trypsin-like peptidase domain-containing protein [Roseimaritima multifibrata]QDS92619.1 Putative serine protease HtrA [Roseimaritima multifibrata]
MLFHKFRRSLSLSPALRKISTLTKVSTAIGLAAAFTLLPTVVSSQALAADELSGPRALSKAFRDAAKVAIPSVVTVVAYGQQSGAENSDPSQPDNPLQPMPRDRSGNRGNGMRATGLGSGVVLSSEGTVVTNNHVVESAEKVIVRLQDGRELTATEVHGDPDNDLATLRLDIGDVELQPMELGNSDQMEIGDWVLAIGSPFRLEATVSAGIISAKGRTIDRIRRGSLLQTDAAINPGNSGGALVDLDGRLVGINTAIATRNGSYQGIGFAIPISQVRWVAEELLAHGRVRRAAMGIRLAELNASVARKVNLPVGLGVLVYEVINNSAAAQAGIQPLDVILEFAGQRVREPVELQNVVERMPIGSTQPVKIYRKGEELDLNVVLAPLDDPTDVLRQEPHLEKGKADQEKPAKGDEEAAKKEAKQPAKDKPSPAVDEAPAEEKTEAPAKEEAAAETAEAASAE